MSKASCAGATLYNSHLALFLGRLQQLLQQLQQPRIHVLLPLQRLILLLPRLLLQMIQMCKLSYSLLCHLPHVHFLLPLQRLMLLLLPSSCRYGCEGRHNLLFDQSPRVDLLLR